MLLWLTRPALFFFFNDTTTSKIYTLSLHDALPIFRFGREEGAREVLDTICRKSVPLRRSEEHTSELQSRFDLVCRLLLEKKKLEATSHLLLSSLTHFAHPLTILSNVLTLSVL